MKIGLVYTSTTPELISVVEQEVKNVLGDTCVMQSYENPSILKETILAGKVTPSGAAMLMDLYMAAVKDGAEVVYNLCSSVGEVADEAKSFMESIGIPLVRVDELMCERAVIEGTRIGLKAEQDKKTAEDKQQLEGIKIGLQAEQSKRESDARQQSEGIKIGSDVAIKQRQMDIQERNKPTKGE